MSLQCVKCLSCGKPVSMYRTSKFEQYFLRCKKGCLAFNWHRDEIPGRWRVKKEKFI